MLACDLVDRSKEASNDLCWFSVTVIMYYFVSM